MRAHAAIGAAVGWFALGLQYALLVRGHEQGPLSATIRFFSYFTILTNTLVTIAYTTQLITPRAERRFFTRPSVQSGIALSIVLVGVVYSILLRRIWDPHGWQLVADHLLHDVAPLLFLAYWVLWVPKHNLTPSAVWAWTLYPVAFFAYALAQARITGWYPYPFIDAGSLGYLVVIRNAAIILAVFVAAGFVLVMLGRRFAGSE